MAGVMSLLLLQGCSWFRSWGEPKPTDPAPLVKFKPTLKVRKAWSTGVGSGMGPDYRRILEALRDLRIQGRVATREDELDWLRHEGHAPGA